MIAFVNGTLITEDNEIKDHVLLVEDGKIVDIADSSNLPSHAVQIDINGQYLVPALIDLQIYGAGKYLFSAELTTASLDSISDTLVRSGTGTYLITLATNTLQVFEKAIEKVLECTHPALGGLHLEGPYFNPAKRGAHHLELLRLPDYREIENLIKKAKGVIKMMTIAPELFSEDILKMMSDYGVVLSAGHSNATYSEAKKGFEKYISTATHLYNAMPSLHHREPGLIAAIFDSPAIYASIIPDGIHVDYKMVDLAKRIMGDRLFLITDAVTETQKGLTHHIFAGDRYTLPDGTLSGSAITLLQGVANMIKHTNTSRVEAFKMASAIPARVMSYADKGLLQKGALADLLIFDENYKVLDVYKRGEQWKG